MEVADKEGTAAACSAGHGGSAGMSRGALQPTESLAKGTRGRKEQKERKGAGDTHPSDSQC